MKQDDLLLTPEDLDKLAKDNPLLDFSFEDDYREECRIMRETQLAKVKQELCANCDTPLLREGELEQAKHEEKKRIHQSLLLEWQKYAKKMWNLDNSQTLPPWVRQALKEGKLCV